MATCFFTLCKCDNIVRCCHFGSFSLFFRPTLVSPGSQCECLSLRVASPQGGCFMSTCLGCARLSPMRYGPGAGLASALLRLATGQGPGCASLGRVLQPFPGRFISGQLIDLALFPPLGPLCLEMTQPGAILLNHVRLGSQWGSK